MWDENPSQGNSCQNGRWKISGGEKNASGDGRLPLLIVEQRMSECLEIAERAYILQRSRADARGSAGAISAIRFAQGVSGGIDGREERGKQPFTYCERRRRQSTLRWR